MKQDLTKGQNDYVNLLRAVMILSSALSNLDSVVHDKKYIKFNLKNTVTDWQNVVNITTPDIMKAITEEDEKLVIDIIMNLDGFDESIECKKEEKKNLMLFYIKVESALNHLMLIENINVISEALKYYSKEVSKGIKSQYGAIVSDESVSSKIKECTIMSRKIMYLKEEEDGLGMVDNKLSE
jgi:hypothetical protein